MNVYQKKHIDFIYCFIIFSAILWNTHFGTIAAAIFLITGGVYFLFRFKRSLLGIKNNLILLAMPALGAISAFWSQNPAISLRLSTQLTLTTIIGISLTYNVKKDHFLAALALSIIIIMALSLTSNNTAISGLSGEEVLVGYLSSKNYLAQSAAIGTFVGFGLFFWANNLSLKIIGLLCFFMSLLVLLKAHSLGATVLTIVALGTCLIIHFFSTSKIQKSIKRKIIMVTASIIIILISLIISFLGTNEFNNYMYDIGKDPTLTRRTLIWDRAMASIFSNPILGTGAHAVFREGNSLGEDIWDIAAVSHGSGFNFHNMFIDTTVHLGLIGLIVYIYMLGRIFQYMKIVFINDFGKKDYIIFMFFIFFILRSAIEVDWFKEFTITQLILCYCFIRLKHRSNERAYKWY